MALYFYFNETTGDMVYSDQATYDVEGYMSLGEQTNMRASKPAAWVFQHKRYSIKTVVKDPLMSGKITGLTSMGCMFTSCLALTAIDLSGFDTSSVTTMMEMFSDCPNLVDLDLSCFDTSHVSNMQSMFLNCTSLTSLDLSGFDTSQVTNMNGMINSCSNLVNLDLSGFDTSKVTNGAGMLYSDNIRIITISDSMSNMLSQLPADQYYPATGGAPTAKSDLTAGTWVRDEADLSLVTSIVEQAQMSQAISRRIGKLNRDLRAEIDKATPSVDVIRTKQHQTSYDRDTLEIVTDSTGKVTEMYFVSA